VDCQIQGRLKFMIELYVCEKSVTYKRAYTPFLSSMPVSRKPGLS
jgi:hypothetical protein